MLDTVKAEGNATAGLNDHLVVSVPPLITPSVSE